MNCDTGISIEPDSAQHRAPTDQRQFLSLSGGGFRGMYTALVLEALEKQAKRPLGEVFDVIAGTSVGAWIAAALALQIPATDIQAVIASHGPVIFNGSPRKWRFPRSHNPLRFLYRPRYAKEPLRKAIGTLFGEYQFAPLSSISAPLVISAVDIASSTPVILLSGGLAGKHATDLPLCDALLATSAAPTYFPVHRVGRHSFVDGGLIANAPELVAVTETIRHLGAALEEVRVLSIGTAASRHTISLNTKAPGLVTWFLNHGLVQLTLSAQEQLAVEQCAVLLRDRYLRLDHCPDDAHTRNLRLDSVSAASIESLRQAADETIRSLSRSNRAAVRRFLSHQSQGPRRSPVLSASFCGNGTM